MLAFVMRSAILTVWLFVVHHLNNDQFTFASISELQSVSDDIVSRCEIVTDQVLFAPVAKALGHRMPKLLRIP
jgi:hypothetical protein